MPNQNPAGPNQPLDQHPLPNGGIYHVAADSAAYTPLVGGGADNDFVPSPIEGGARRIGPGCMVLTLAGATVDADVELIQKDADGNETILSTVTLSFPDDQNFFTLQAAVFLAPGEELLVRYTGGDNGVVSALVSWDDVRNVIFEFTSLNDTTQKRITPDPDPGTCFVLAAILGLVPGAYFQNSDSITHNIDLYASDGVNSILIAQQTIPEGEAAFIQLGCANFPPDGLRLQAILQEPVTPSGPVIAKVPMSLTNQGPARQDQGGAY